MPVAVELNGLLPGLGPGRGAPGRGPEPPGRGAPGRAPPGPCGRGVDGREPWPPGPGWSERMPWPRSWAPRSWAPRSWAPRSWPPRSWPPRSWPPRSWPRDADRPARRDGGRDGPVPYPGRPCLPGCGSRPGSPGTSAARAPWGRREQPGWPGDPAARVGRSPGTGPGGRRLRDRRQLAAGVGSRGGPLAAAPSGAAARSAEPLADPAGAGLATGGDAETVPPPPPRPAGLHGPPEGPARCHLAAAHRPDGRRRAARTASVPATAGLNVLVVPPCRRRMLP